MLDLLVESPTYSVPDFENVPYLDAAGTVDQSGKMLTLFVLNRDLHKPHRLELQWQDAAPSKAATAHLLTGDDLKASNGFSTPQKVQPQPFDVPSPKGSRTEFEVPPRSYLAMQFALA